MSTKLLSLEQTINQYNLAPQKKLGQNFLLDMQITRRIIQNSQKFSGCDVIEIGPGPGALTRAILETDANFIYAIEFDQRCVEALKQLEDIYPNRLKVIHADALKINLRALTNNPIKIVANLPYNISTALLTNWLGNLDSVESMTLMFQKEVADRINAIPGGKNYGRLSVICQYMCDISHLFDLPPHAFTPAPKVFSSVLYFKPKKLSDEAKDLKPFVERVTADAFCQKRKMIRTTLKNLFSMDELASLNIDPTLRAENLSLQNYTDLAKILSNRI